MTRGSRWLIWGAVSGFVFVAGKATALVISVWAGGVSEVERFSVDIFGRGDFGEAGGPVGPALGSSGVAVFSFGVGHFGSLLNQGRFLGRFALLLLFVKGDFAEVRVVFHELQLVGGVLLIFGGGDVVFAVLGAHEPDDFALFAFLLCHEDASAGGLSAIFRFLACLGRRGIVAGFGLRVKDPGSERGVG